MFGLIKQIFISEMIFFSCNPPSVSSLKRISMTNKECKVRPRTNETRHIEWHETCSVNVD